MSKPTPETQGAEQASGVSAPETSEMVSTVQETRKQVEDVTKLKTRPAPWAFNVVTAVSLLLSTAWVANYLHKSRSLDSRSAKEMVLSRLTWRSQMSEEMKKNIGEISDERGGRDAKATQCQMELNQFVPSEAPKDPKLLELWKYNNEHRGDHVYVPGLNPADFFTPHKLAPEDDEQKKQAARFDFHKNTDSYLLRLRRKEYEQLFRDRLMKEPWFKYQYGWLRLGFETYKKEHPVPRDKNADEWNAKLLLDYLGEAYFDQPPTPVYGCDGKIALTKDKMPCYFIKPVADAHTRANIRMCEKGLKGIKYDTCGRSNQYQSAIWVTDKGYGCSLPKRGWATVAVSFPGTSSHEAYLSADVSNWPEAEPFLIVEGGIICSSDEDPGHCSPVEWIPNGMKLKKKMGLAYITVLGKDAWDAAQGGWEDYWKQ